MSNWNPDIFSKAWNFATLYHQGQTYGGAQKGQKIPYINHLGSVGVEVIWALSTAPELDGDLAIQCALLHDTIVPPAEMWVASASTSGCCMPWPSARNS